MEQSQKYQLQETTLHDTPTIRHQMLNLAILGKRLRTAITVWMLFVVPVIAYSAKGTSIASVTDLPVIELRATVDRSDVLAIILSGDGGWADLDKVFGKAFQERGVSTVGFDCLKYFWKTRQPAEVSRDIEALVRHYQQAWEKKQVLLVGFSFGACWLPSLVNRLPADLLAKVSLVVLLGPGNFVNVEVHVMDWMGDEIRPGALEVQPEAVKIDKPLLCVYGTEEDDSLCPQLKKTNVKVLAMPGNHHYNYNYDPVIEAIFAELAAVQSKVNVSH